MQPFAPPPSGHAPYAPPFAPAPYGHPDDRFVGPGGRDGDGVLNQNGVVVVRPGRVAFVSVGEQLGWGTFAGRAALGGAGFVRLSGPARQRAEAEAIQGAVRQLAALHPQTLDAEVPRWIQHYGGIYLSASDAVVAHKKLLFGERLSFVRGGTRVHVGFAARALGDPALQRLLSGFRPNVGHHEFRRG